MVPSQDTSPFAEDDALVDNGGLDEFDEATASAAADEFAAYEKAGRVEDVDKVRELIPEDTKVRLGIISAELATPTNNKKVKPGHEYIYAKFEVTAPETYADGSRNFGVYFRLTAKANDPQRPQNTAWAVTERQLLRIAAAVQQLRVTDPAIQEFFAPAVTQAAAIQGSPTERRQEFFVAVETLIKDELVGHSFETDIGVDAARVYQGRTYREAQSVGRPYYPDRERAKPKSAKKAVAAAA